MPSIADIARCLTTCEERDPKAAYGSPLVHLNSGGNDIFVVSDLHLAAGTRADGTYDGRENFFSDGVFQRFLRFVSGRKKSSNAVLVINGDFIDFLRITDIPSTDADFEQWTEILQRIGIERTVENLKASITKKEKTYGLKTHEFKSLWKIAVAVRGHALFFDALAEWLSGGNKIIVVKGNHDLEWFWPGVRSYLRLVLAERLQTGPAEDIVRILSERVLPFLLFIDEALIIDKSFYVEHGHRYDRLSHVVGGPLLSNNVELNIPFGSFFNRYLLNRIELSYPFFDNVRPRENLLPLLFRERFFLGIKIFLQHLPYALHIIPKRYFRYLFGRVLWYALPLVVLLAWLIALGVSWIQEGGLPPLAASIINLLSSTSAGLLFDPQKGLLWMAASFFFTRIVAYFQLEEPTSLAEFARKKFVEHGDYQFITFGHTHDPDEAAQDGRWFFNSGTWIPIVEISSAEIRHDRTYTYVHLAHDSSGRFSPHVLQRWDDAAGRSDSLVIVRQK
jgi:predicted phosphodiesterase